MATVLYRLGRFAFRRRRWVLLAWIALFVGAGVAAGTLAGDPKESFEIPGTESQEAFDLLEERYPNENGADNTSARVVFAAPDGETLTDPDNQSVIDETIAEIQGLDHVAEVAPVSPEAGSLSEDGTIGFATVNYDVTVLDLEEADRDTLVDTAEAGQDAGLQVEFGGEAATSQEPPEGMSSELIGIAIALLVLIITFGSFVAAGLPILNAILGVGISISAITAASGFIDIGSNATMLATMLGLAVSIDYALFVVSRYRHELSLGRDGEEAMGRALGTAGSAVVFAGLTVMIALSGLFVVGIRLLTEMGLAAALAVGVAVLIALTLLPAMLGFSKHRILGGRIPGLKARDPEADDLNGKQSNGTRWARLVTGNPKKVLVVAMLALLAAALPAAGLRLGLPGEDTMAEDTTQRQAYDLVSEGFGEGFNGPLLVVVDAAGSSDPQAAIEEAGNVIRGVDGVVPEAVSPPTPNEGGDTATINVIPETGPTAEETDTLVRDLRDSSSQLEELGARLLVSGTTAVQIDFTSVMSDALIPYLSIVVGLSFILLILVFRSLVVPLMAALGFLLTMGATFGLLVAIFQWGWVEITPPAPIMSFLPIILIGIVFGLAMDYQVFLVTRMREEFIHGAAPTRAVVTGFQHGARVVTAAAIIMMSVFGAFMLSGEDFILQIGGALAGAVAIDAFLVRMTIVPAVLTLLGKRAWGLPAWLDRIVPNVDVEGEKLRKVLGDTPAEDEHELASSRT